MRISNLNTINFGYNKNYHDNLQARLAKMGKIDPLARNLKERDKLLLINEDEILKVEQSKKESVSDWYRNNTQSYIQEKYELAKSINDLLGDDSYSQDLIAHYRKEIAAGDLSFYAKNWRQTLINYLKTLELNVENIITNPKPKKLSKDEAEIEKIKAAQIRARLQSPFVQTPPVIFKQTQNDSEIKSIRDFEIEQAQKHNLTLFVPSKSSPKGLTDVVGMEELKDSFQQDIIDYVKNPSQIKQDEDEYGIRAPRGFLLFGPPGCGKTFITEALASECNFRMYKMNVSQIGAMYVNKSANNLEEAFQFLYDVAKNKDMPILLFMDEVDSFAKNRNSYGTSGSEDMKVLTTLLKHIEQSRDNNIILFAATNKYNLLDDAFISRFDSAKYIGLPDMAQIKALLIDFLSKRSKGINLSKNADEIEKLAKQMLGYSNRSIVFILDEACKIAKKDNRSDIRFSHVAEAIKKSDLQKIDEKDYKKNDNKETQKVVLGFC